MVFKAVSSGTLTINGAAWSAPTNNIIDATRSAVWTPAANAYGELNAFTAVARDDAGLESATPVQAKISVAAVQEPPTLTTFGVSLTNTNINTTVPISLFDLIAGADEKDIDGSVTAFVVKAVSSGTLTINGAAWSATTNNTIDASSSAVWTPPTNTYGILNAFTAVARDNEGLESATPVQAKVNVTVIVAGGTAWSATTRDITVDTEPAVWKPAADANRTLDAFTAVAKNNQKAVSTTPDEIQGNSELNPRIIIAEDNIASEFDIFPKIIGIALPLVASNTSAILNDYLDRTDYLYSDHNYNKVHHDYDSPYGTESRTEVAFITVIGLSKSVILSESDLW